MERGGDGGGGGGGGGVVILSPANKKVLKSMHGGNGLRNEKVTIYHNPLVPSP